MALQEPRPDWLFVATTMLMHWLASWTLNRLRRRDWLAICCPLFLPCCDGVAGPPTWQPRSSKECHRRDNFGFVFQLTPCTSLDAALTRMALIKPVYGQLDAPRLWWQEATRRLTQEGWTPHDLDPCLFVLHHHHDDGSTVPCGLIALHVDDMLGAGDRSCPTYVAAEQLNVV